MVQDNEHRCPECNSQMRPILLIDRSRLNEFRSVDCILTYTSTDAKPSFWTGTIPAEGVVSSFACTQCGRILLYAQKTEEK